MEFTPPVLYTFVIAIFRQSSETPLKFFRFWLGGLYPPWCIHLQKCMQPDPPQFFGLHWVMGIWRIEFSHLSRFLMYNVYTLPYRSFHLNAIVSTLTQDAQKAARQPYMFCGRGWLFWGGYLRFNCNVYINMYIYREREREKIYIFRFNICYMHCSIQQIVAQNLYSDLMHTMSATFEFPPTPDILQGRASSWSHHLKSVLRVPAFDCSEVVRWLQWFQGWPRCKGHCSSTVPPKAASHCQPTAMMVPPLPAAIAVLEEAWPSPAHFRGRMAWLPLKWSSWRWTLYLSVAEVIACVFRWTVLVFTFHE